MEAAVTHLSLLRPRGASLPLSSVTERAKTGRPKAP
jgi:hypothetical protein